MHDEWIQQFPQFLLVFCRVAAVVGAMLLMAGLWMPVRVMALVAGAISIGLMPGLSGGMEMPGSVWALVMGAGGEVIFGAAMGMSLGLVFVAAHWAGELMGQQMGIGLSGLYDPQSGQMGSPVGTLYLLLAVVIFLAVRGHHAVLRGVHESFEALPVMSAGLHDSILAMLIGFVQASTNLVLYVAAPVVVTLLGVELAMGFLSRTMPQMSSLSVGLTVRSMVGMALLMVTIMLSSRVMRGAVLEWVEGVRVGWSV